MNIPYEVRQLIAIIESYNPFLVGGCVRDSLIGIEPKDFDIVVDKLDHILLNMLKDGGWRNTEVVTQNGKTRIWNLVKYFPIYDTIPGTKISYISDEKPYLIELIEYEGGSINSDSERRDLTINSLYYDIKNDNIVDPTGKGITDINNKVIRFNSKRVVYNDHLRIVRAYRLAKQLGFDIEPTSLSLCRNEFHTMMEVVKPGRLLKEIEKLCLG